MEHMLICDNGNPEVVVDLCRQRGLGIEVQAFYHPEALSDPVLLERTADAVAGLPIVAVHGPFGDLNPGSFDPLVRETSRTRIQQGYDIAVYLGAKHIVYHDGRVPKTSPEGAWIARAVRFWDAFMDQVPGDVHVYLENMLEEGPSVLGAILDQVDRPNLHANLDIGHAHCNSCTPVAAWIASLGERIGYVHLHDNHGACDEHLGLGRGSAPLQRVCQALEVYAPRAVWAIEAHGEGVAQSLTWLEEHGFLSLEPARASEIAT